MVGLRSASSIALALVLGAAGSARAAELIAGWDVDGIWDSNVLHASTGDEESDVSVRTGPDLTLREPLGNFTYELNGQIRYENFGRLDSLDTNSIGDLDYVADGQGAWRITDQTRVSLSDEFLWVSSIQNLLETTATPEQVAIFQPGRDRIRTNTATGSVTHRLGPLWELTTQMQHSMYDYEDPLQADTQSGLGMAQLTRSITPRLVLGFGGQAQRQVFQSVDGSGDDQGTTFFQGFGVVQYSFSPTFTLSANAGPSWSVPDSVGNEVASADYFAVDPSTCPVGADGFPVFNPRASRGGCRAAQWKRAGSPLTIPVTPGVGGAPRQQVTAVPFDGDSPSGQLSYFGRIELAKTWRNTSAHLGFSRQASNSSGVNGSTIVSAVTTDVTWFPSTRWSVSLNGTYTQQEAANKIPEQIISIDSATGIVPNAFFAAGFQNGFLVAIPCNPGDPGCFEYTPDPVGVPRLVTTGREQSNAIDITTWRVELRAHRRLSRNLSLDGTASYFDQKNKNSFAFEAEQRTWRVVFGVTWTFDPIPL